MPTSVAVTHRSLLKAAAVLALVAGGLAGCAAPESDAAADAALAFYAAVQTDPARACELLAPTTRTALEESAEAPCAEAIEGADLPAASLALDVDGYVRSARVVLDADVAFLSLFGGSWKVTAAGCLLQPGNAYDCTVEGG